MKTKYFKIEWNENKKYFIQHFQSAKIEIKNEFENIFTCLPRAQMGSNHEKIEVENLMTHSL